MTRDQQAPSAPASWQDQPATNPHRQTLIEHIDPAMNRLAASLGLDTTDPRQRLAFISRLATWTDDARDTAHRQLDPDHDPSHSQPL